MEHEVLTAVIALYIIISGAMLIIHNLPYLAQLIAKKPVTQEKTN